MEELTEFIHFLRNHESATRDGSGVNSQKSKHFRSSSLLNH